MEIILCNESKSQDMAKLVDYYYPKSLVGGVMQVSYSCDPSFCYKIGWIRKSIVKKMREFRYLDENDRIIIKGNILNTNIETEIFDSMVIELNRIKGGYSDCENGPLHDPYYFIHLDLELESRLLEWSREFKFPAILVSVEFS